MLKGDKPNYLVSVIIPVYNRGNKVIKTLDSVYHQVYRPIELIIVNDGSEDNSGDLILDWKILKESTQFVIHYVFQKNMGAPTARNVGIRISTGEYIQFLDSDDYIDPKKLVNQIIALEESNLKVAVCDFVWVDSMERVAMYEQNYGNLWIKIARGGSISISTPLFHKSFIDRGLRWNERLKIRQDMDYMFKLMMMAKKYIYTPGYWFYYVQHDNARISDLYTASTYDYLIRIKSLLAFGYYKFKFIPLKNKYYFLFGVLVLSYRLSALSIKKIIKK